jgi:hypothetical protein
MSTTERRATAGVILQELIYERPSESKLKAIFYGLGARMTLTPDMTRGVIEGEWCNSNSHEYRARANMGLWNSKSIEPEKLKEVVDLFAKCTRVKISEILPL